MQSAITNHGHEVAIITAPGFGQTPDRWQVIWTPPKQISEGSTEGRPLTEQPKTLIVGHHSSELSARIRHGLIVSFLRTFPNVRTWEELSLVMGYAPVLSA